MFKYLVIINFLIALVVTQDMPPPEWDISTIPPLTTTEPTTLPPTTPDLTTIEPVTATTEEDITTTNIETSTTPTTTTTEEAAVTTTSTATSEITTSESPSTTPATTTSTRRNDMPISPATDSPFWPPRTTTLAPNYPFMPSNPDYFGLRCYFKRQYGYPQLRWTCKGFKYIYPIECFKCCFLQYSSFAGCYRVHDHHCNILNHHHGYYK